MRKAHVSRHRIEDIAGKYAVMSRSAAGSSRAAAESAALAASTSGLVDRRLVLAIYALERIERACQRSGDQTQTILEIAADALVDLRDPCVSETDLGQRLSGALRKVHCQPLTAAAVCVIADILSSALGTVLGVEIDTATSRATLSVPLATASPMEEAPRAR